MRFRIGSILVTAFSALASSAYAGDTASVEVLGFSEDGRIFAFEEYGIQDGSGFPYANRFYIDTTKDGFVAGTPIRVRLDDEGASLDAAREEAREAGQSILADEELQENRGNTAGWNPVTEYSADPKRISVNPRPVFPPVDDALEFRLEELALEPPEHCDALGGDIVGFRLTRIATVPGEQTEIIHEDRMVPSSRRCPLGYQIGGVQTFFPAEGPPVFAVLVAIRSFGFEGPDYRWMAVTGRF